MIESYNRKRHQECTSMVEMEIWRRLRRVQVTYESYRALAYRPLNSKSNPPSHLATCPNFSNYYKKS